MKTENKYTKKHNRKLMAILIGVTVLIFSASLFYVYKDNDSNMIVALGGEEQTTEVTEEESEIDSTAKSEKSFLLFCCDSDKTEIKFMWLVKSYMPERKISIRSLSPYLTVNYNGEAKSLSDIFASQGDKILKENAEKVLGETIDGYMGSTVETFKQMINYFGSVPISVEEKIEYKGDFNLIIMDGTIGMKGDVLYKYLCYQGTLGDKGLDERAETLKEVFEALLKEKYIEKEDKIFAKMSNSLMTDISIVEFSQSRENIESILRNGIAEYKIY